MIGKPERTPSALICIAVAFVALAIVGCDSNSVSHNGDEQEATSKVAQREQSAPDRPATPSTLRPVPESDVYVTVEGLMSGGHVAWLADRVLCPEEVLVSSELEFDIVTSLTLASHAEMPDDLRAFLLDEFSLDVDTVEHRWVVEDRLILFKVCPWTDGEESIAAAAIEVQRLSVPPGWAVSEAGFAFYCA